MAEKKSDAPTKHKRSKLIFLLVLIMLIVAAGGGYYYWRTHLQGDATQQAKREKPPAPEPIFFALDAFTVNLGDTDRVLYIGVTLRMKDEATRAKLNNYLPEVRSRLLLLFSRQNPDQLATEQGKQQLIVDIKKTLAVPLVPGEPPQVITDVLYTTFILR